MAKDAMIYVAAITPILLVVGGVSFADITTHYLINLFKRIKFK